LFPCIVLDECYGLQTYPVLIVIKFLGITRGLLHLIPQAALNRIIRIRLLNEVHAILLLIRTSDTQSRPFYERTCIHYTV
jgi:hypothetical protein